MILRECKLLTGFMFLSCHSTMCQGMVCRNKRRIGEASGPDKEAALGRWQKMGKDRLCRVVRKENRRNW